MKPSTMRLVAALEAQGAPTLKNMIRNARKGYYHEFDSDLTFPMVILKSDLEAHGFPELAQMVVDGAFDAGKDEGEMWANSLEGMETFSDPDVLEYGKGLARAICEEQGVPWSESEWEAYVKKYGFPV